VSIILVVIVVHAVSEHREQMIRAEEYRQEQKVRREQEAIFKRELTEKYPILGDFLEEKKRSPDIRPLMKLSEVEILNEFFSNKAERLRPVTVNDNTPLRLLAHRLNTQFHLLKSIGDACASLPDLIKAEIAYGDDKICNVHWPLKKLFELGYGDAVNNISNDTHYIKLESGSFVVRRHPVAQARFCNLVPFRISYSLSFPVLEQGNVVTGWWVLRPGQCHTHRQTFKGVAPELYIYGKSYGDQQQVAKIYGVEPNLGLVAQFNSANHKVPRCVTLEKMDSEIDTLSSNNEEKCQNGKVRVDFARITGESSTSIDSTEKKFEYYFYEPKTGILDLITPMSWEQRIEQAKSSAEYFGIKLEQQAKASSTLAREGVRYFFGAQIEDINGPLIPGITLYNPTEQTIFGYPQPFSQGDELLAINGEVVFSTDDALLYLKQHAESRDGGIKVPYQATIRRANQNSIIQAETTFFFNTRHSDFSGDQSLLAAYYGALNSLTLGSPAITDCLLGNIPPALQDGVRWFLNSPLAWEEMKGLKIPPRAKYNNVQECVWVVRQRDALMRQKHETTYNGAAIVGMVSPSAPRLMLEKTLFRSTTNRIRQNALRAAIANAGLEGVEAALWVLNDSAPEATFRTKADDFKIQASIGVTAGFILGGVTAKKFPDVGAR